MGHGTLGGTHRRCLSSEGWRVTSSPSCSGEPPNPPSNECDYDPPATSIISAADITQLGFYPLNLQGAPSNLEVHFLDGSALHRERLLTPVGSGCASSLLLVVRPSCQRRPRHHRLLNRNDLCYIFKDNSIVGSILPVLDSYHSEDKSLLSPLSVPPKHVALYTKSPHPLKCTFELLFFC